MRDEMHFGEVRRDTVGSLIREANDLKVDLEDERLTSVEKQMILFYKRFLERKIKAKKVENEEKRGE